MKFLWNLACGQCGVCSAQIKRDRTIVSTNNWLVTMLFLIQKLGIASFAGPFTPRDFPHPCTIWILSHIFCCCLFQFGIFLSCHSLFSTWPENNLSTNPKQWHRLFSCATGGDCRCWCTPSMLFSSSWEAFSCKTVQSKPNGGALHHSGVSVEFGAQVTKHGRKRAQERNSKF